MLLPALQTFLKFIEAKSEYHIAPVTSDVIDLNDSAIAAVRVWSELLYGCGLGYCTGVVRAIVLSLLYVCGLGYRYCTGVVWATVRVWSALSRYRCCTGMVRAIALTLWYGCGLGYRAIVTVRVLCARALSKILCYRYSAGLARDMLQLLRGHCARFCVITQRDSQRYPVIATQSTVSQNPKHTCMQYSACVSGLFL